MNSDELPQMWVPTSGNEWDIHDTHSNEDMATISNNVSANQLMQHFIQSDIRVFNEEAKKCHEGHHKRISKC